MITNLTIGKNGRLGNQIFQYAILKSISLKNGFDVVLPFENTQQLTLGRYNPSIGEFDRYKLDLFECFDIDAKIDKFENIIPQLKFQYNEYPTMYFDSNIYNLPDGTNYDGFFQCAKYYDQNRQEIKNSLKFKSELMFPVLTYLENLKIQNGKTHITTVHIRRGDGVQDEGKFTTLLSKEYYNNVFEQLRSEDNLFLLISDDIAWCRRTFSGSDIFFIETSLVESRAPEHIIDFYALSSGDDIIQSVSTYSWWASWLSSAKRIYSPNKWFGPYYAHYNEEGIRPSEWKLCDVESGICL